MPGRRYATFLSEAGSFLPSLHLSLRSSVPPKPSSEIPMLHSQDSLKQDGREKTKILLNSWGYVTLPSTLNTIKRLNFFLCLFHRDDCLSVSLTGSAGPN